MMRAFRRMAVSPLVFICEKNHPGPGDWGDCPMILNERGLARERVEPDSLIIMRTVAATKRVNDSALYRVRAWCR